MPVCPTTAPPQTPVEPKKPVKPSIPSAPTTEPEPRKNPLQPGDLILMCSDGLSDMLDDTSIAQVLQMHESLAAAGTALIEAANDAGGKDNISLVLVRASGGSTAANRSWWPFRR